MIYTFENFGQIKQSDIFDKITFNCEEGRQFYSIILNPDCDLIIQENRENPKAKYLKFAGIISSENIIKNIFAKLQIPKSQINGEEYISGRSYNDVIDTLKHFFNGSIYPRYYYLPSLPNYFNHSMVDFQLLEIRKYSDEFYKELLEKKIAGLKSSWKEALPVRYSSYYSRIGVEDLSEQFIESIFIDFSINLNRSS